MREAELLENGAGHVRTSPANRSLADAVLAVGARTGLPTLVRVSVPLTAASDPLDWLAVQPSGSRSYWSPRDSDTVTAMWGAADVYEGADRPDFERMSAYTRHMLGESPGDIRYFGGLRFDAGRTPESEWKPFGAFRFTLPRFEFVARGEAAELACNLVMPRDRGRIREIADRCRTMPWPDRPSSWRLPRAEHRHDEPVRPVWMARVREALDGIRDHAVQKVVLARRSSFAFPRTVPAIGLMARLREQTPNRFHFLFEAPDGSAFLGATPERLLRREGSYLFTEAVAGTRPTAENETDDAALRDALLASEKDQREHLSVRWAIEEILRPFCESLSVDAHATEMRLSRGRHLVSRFDAVLRDGVDTWQLMRHLHPTPAVGGYPAAAALRAIRRAEAFDRGWYAGPVGCIGVDEAEFAVALRCALVRDRDVHLFSGAGIVDGSEPASEWDEIETKIVDFSRVLGFAGVPAP